MKGGGTKASWCYCNHLALELMKQNKVDFLMCDVY